MKVELDLQIPEGYEVAEGKQPRIPKNKEYFIDLHGGDVYHQCRHDNTYDPFIILKKKAPEYKIEVLNYGERDITFVSVSALKHALDILGTYALTNEDLSLYDNLRKLIK